MWLSYKSVLCRPHQKYETVFSLMSKSIYIYCECINLDLTRNPIYEVVFLLFTSGLFLANLHRLLLSALRAMIFPLVSSVEVCVVR